MYPPRHKRWLFTLLAALSMLVGMVSPALAEPDATPLSGPRIGFDHRQHHFGQVTQGKIVTHRFPFTNVGTGELVVDDVSTPCGCTVVLPDKSVLKPGESSYIEVKYDSAARSGEVTRIITVLSNDVLEPELTLEVVATVDASMHGAFESGEALFGPKCGKCHADPNVGLTGQELYGSACWFCHGKYREGHTAPALPAFSPEREAFLLNIIKNGVPGTEMPGFSQVKKGPLDLDQIRSLLPVLYGEPPTPPTPAPEVHEMPALDDPGAPFFK